MSEGADRPGDKERMVREEQDARGFREPYGRRAGERFREHDFPHSYPTPELRDWRRALRAYVSGHDRNWEADRKYAEAAEAGDEASGEPGEEGAPAGGGGPRFGVGVPDRDRLEFHRGASVWRDELPESRRMPRHTDRELDGRRGRGEQA